MGRVLNYILQQY